MERENLDILAVRRRLGRDTWGVPYPHGEDTWVIDHHHERARIMVSVSNLHEPGMLWIHASMSRQQGVPTYEDLKLLHYAIWDGKGFAYQVFVPEAEHININERVLHLWGRLDGEGVLPNFGIHGTI